MVQHLRQPGLSARRKPANPQPQQAANLTKQLRFVQRAVSRPNFLPPADLARLQQLVGNRAVSELLDPATRRNPADKQEAGDAFQSSESLPHLVGGAGPHTSLIQRWCGRPPNEHQIVHTHRVKLSDCYSRVQATPIMNMVGDANREASQAAINMEMGGARHWLGGTDILGYALSNYGGSLGSAVEPDSVVTIRVPGLAEVIAQYAHHWTQERQGEAPHFQNFQFGGGKALMSEYALVGHLVRSDVVHIKTPHLIEHLLNGSSLLTAFPIVGNQGLLVEIQIDITFEILADRMEGQIPWKKEVLQAALRKRYEERPTIAEPPLAGSPAGSLGATGTSGPRAGNELGPSHPTVQLASMEVAEQRSWNVGDRFEINGIEGVVFVLTANHHAGEALTRDKLRPQRRGG